MGSRVLWIVGILLAGIFLWGMHWVVTPNSGDTEFQKMLEATEQIKSFRGSYVGNLPITGQHSEKLWELDCNRSILHKQTQESPVGSDALQIKEDFFIVGSDQKFTRGSDGSWEKSKYNAALYSASWYCDAIAQGTVRDLLPDTRRLLKSATFAEGDKKTINGVRCQDWSFQMHSQTSGQKGTVCIGVEDHLPYEMTVDNNDHYSYTDYNRSLQFDGPDGVLDSASSTAGSN